MSLPALAGFVCCAPLHRRRFACKTTAPMGLLDQLFRHKDDLPGADSATPVPVDRAAGPVARRDTGSGPRGVGAIAAAVGIQPGRGLPVEFEVTLGELLPRTPQNFLQSGSHDVSRVLKVPLGEVTEGLAKGRAEIPLASLVALAPDVFLPDATDAETTFIRLPLQRLLQQIGTSVAAASRDSSHGIPLFALPASHLHSARIAGKGDELAAAADQSRSAESPRPNAAQPSPSITPGPTLRATATEPIQKPLELRPHTGVATSTTLRAVILGGKALAPHATAAPVVLAPAGPTGAPVPKATEIPSVQLRGEKAAGEPCAE